MRKRKLLARTAIAIHAQLQSACPEPLRVDLPRFTWGQAERTRRRLDRARRRGWRLAAERLQRQLGGLAASLRSELAAIESACRLPSSRERVQTSIMDLYADLLSLEEEFEETAIDRRARVISVTTEPIELEGVWLGPFQIRLAWEDLASDPPNYRIVALDANPASANESVTHPHVQDEALCEGDGREPIRRALAECRLLDFFLIVAHLLRTYNRSSPYVALADWHGVECNDCGTTVGDDERWTCEKCESALCGECVISCPDCGGVYCGACVERCERCDEHRCLCCLMSCSHCGSECCGSCLNNERCSDCDECENKEEATEGLAAVDDNGRR